jgi:TadE-like protein
VNAGRCLRQRTEGAVAVETGLLMSLVVLLIMGALQIAEVWWTYNTMLLAVGDAARYAMLYSSGPPLVCGLQSQAPQCPPASDTPRANCAAARARQVLSMHQAANVSASVSENIGSSPPKATICASFSLGILGPHLLPSLSVTLISQTTVPLI